MYPSHLTRFAVATHTSSIGLALRPQELEENVEYVEREDEFDVVVDSRDPDGRMRKAEKEEEETIVSIEAIDTVGFAPGLSLAMCGRG